MLCEQARRRLPFKYLLHLETMAIPSGLAESVLVHTQTEHGLNGHVAASAVQRLAVSLTVMALQQNQLAQQHGL